MNDAGEKPEPTDASEHDDDPQGMRGQLDDSMNGLEPEDDLDEASRGIPQTENDDREPL